MHQLSDVLLGLDSWTTAPRSFECMHQVLCVYTIVRNCLNKNYLKSIHLSTNAVLMSLWQGLLSLGIVSFCCLFLSQPMLTFSVMILFRAAAREKAPKCRATILKGMKSATFCEKTFVTIIRKLR